MQPVAPECNASTTASNATSSYHFYRKKLYQNKCAIHGDVDEADAIFHVKFQLTMMFDNEEYKVHSGQLCCHDLLGLGEEDLRGGQTLSYLSC